MKRLSASFCFILVALTSFGQLNVSTNSRSDFIWDAKNKDWVFESKDSESLTFFEFNKDFTLVKHTTGLSSSGYLIKSQEHDEEDGNNQYVL